MLSRPFTASLVCATLSLAACAGDGGRYPSLATRRAERVEGSFTPPPVVLEPAPMPDGTLGTLGELEALARGAHSRFLARAPQARAAVAIARGVSPEDNRWGAAAVALADLDAIRSEAAVALGDLDLLFADASVGFTQRDAIGRTRSEVVALIAEQDRILNELRIGFGT